ncbi:hypothetical protein BdWA1_002678 [Babesia duncani]|uniref:Uncharacterized protein n=1 Tax=Babesia duncani TaxID=323732 RepID=A0AAD9PKK2_9APIC|nr:hypothetical protein BdWA1_002678 [Babesia duncani]
MYEGLSGEIISEVVYERIFLLNRTVIDDVAVTRRILVEVVKSGVYLTIVSYSRMSKHICYYRINPISVSIINHFEDYLLFAHPEISHSIVGSMGHKQKLGSLLSESDLRKNPILLQYLWQIAPLTYAKAIRRLSSAIKIRNEKANRSYHGLINLSSGSSSDDESEDMSLGNPNLSLHKSTSLPSPKPVRKFSSSEYSNFPEWMHQGVDRLVSSDTPPPDVWSYDPNQEDNELISHENTSNEPITPSPSGTNKSMETSEILNANKLQEGTKYMDSNAAQLYRSMDRVVKDFKRSNPFIDYTKMAPNSKRALKESDTFEENGSHDEESPSIDNPLDKTIAPIGTPNVDKSVETISSSIGSHKAPYDSDGLNGPWSVEDDTASLLRGSPPPTPTIPS